MKARTEEDILTQKPLVVTFGNKTYDIKPLTILKAQQWRESLAPIIEKMLNQDGALDDPSKMRGAILASPRDMVEIVLSYSGLNRDEVLEVATEEQMVLAFNVIMGVAFSPFLTQQSVMKMVMDPELLALGRSTKVH